MIQELITNKTIIRYLIHKKLFTPYEQENKFEDQSEYESLFYNFGIIIDYEEIPNDLLIKISALDHEIGSNDYYELERYEYYKLSDIHIVEFDCDNKESKLEKF